MKKRYILLRDSVEYYKGAIFEEMCSNGDQDFKCITPEYSRLREDQEWFYNRELVVDNPGWFEEISLFWMTRKKFRMAKERLGSLIHRAHLDI